MTHPLGDNTILERPIDQRHSEHLRHVRANQPMAHHRISAIGRFGLAVGVAAAVIGLGFALPSFSDDENAPSEGHVPANVR